MDNINTKVLEAFNEVENFNKQINSKFSNFITKCSELEELSNHNYNVQKSLELNKNYFQGYVLESSLCDYLKSNNNKDYSIKELKEYINQYVTNSSEDYRPYYFALELYEMADEIEELIDQKVEYEMTFLYEYDSNISKIEEVQNFQELYNFIKNNLNVNLFSKKLIDENEFSKIIFVLNEVFSFYMNGYPAIPEEYLEKSNIN